MFGLSDDDDDDDDDDDVLLLSVSGLQCYGCNVFHGQKYVDVGCSNPEVITCTHSHKGFKHRFCIRTESSESPSPSQEHLGPFLLVFKSSEYLCG